MIIHMVRFPLALVFLDMPLSRPQQPSIFLVVMNISTFHSIHYRKMQNMKMTNGKDWEQILTQSDMAIAPSGLRKNFLLSVAMKPKILKNGAKQLAWNYLPITNLQTLNIIQNFLFCHQIPKHDAQGILPIKNYIQRISVIKINSILFRKK